MPLKTCCYILFLTLLIFTTGSFCFGQLPSTVDEVSLAVTYNNVAGEAGWGAIGALPFGNEQIGGFTAAVTQKSATLTRTKYHGEIGTTVKKFGINLYTNGVVKKYVGAEAGRVSGVGVAIEFPDFEVAGWQASVSIGVEGQNGGQIGKPNAGDTLEALGYDSEVLEAKELYSLNPAPTGLSIVQGNAYKGAWTAELSHPDGHVVTLKGLPELAGQSEYPVHQLITSASTSYELRENVSIEVGVDVGVQTSPTEAKTLEFESAVLVAAKFSFDKFF